MSFFFSKCINEISALFSARNFMLFNFQWAILLPLHAGSSSIILHFPWLVNRFFKLFLIFLKVFLNICSLYCSKSKNGLKIAKWQPFQNFKERVCSFDFRAPSLYIINEENLQAPADMFSVICIKFPLIKNTCNAKIISELNKKRAWWSVSYQAR